MQVDVNALKKDEELFMKSEQQKTEEEQLPVTHFTDKAGFEHAMGKLQAVVGDFRACVQEMLSDSVDTVSSYNVTGSVITTMYVCIQIMTYFYNFT